MPIALSNWLRELRVRHTFLAVGRLRGGAGVRIPADGVAAFHFAIRGACAVVPEGHAPVRLEEGEFMFMREGLAREVWGGAPGARPVSFGSVVPRASRDAARSFAVGDGPAESIVLGGAVCLDTTEARPFIDALPPVVLARRGTPHMGRLQAVIDQLVEEATGGGVESEPVVARLTEVAALLGLRAFASTHDHGVALLGAARDPQLGRALSAIHDEPARAWTVASLGRVARMSRSGFAARFTELVGETPAAYLAQVRVARAERLLRQPGWSMSRVAEAVGYDSPAAFSVAFKRVKGVSPSTLRASHRRTAAIVRPRQRTRPG